MKWLIILLLITPAQAADERAEFRDRNGHFVGSSVKTGKDTTSYYDRNGHFVGTKRDTK